MRLEQARRIAMTLPAASQEPHFSCSSFRVGGKIFATVPPEGGHLHEFVEEEERQLAIPLEPESMERPFWGLRVVGLRVTLAKAESPLVRRLREQAWSRKAPKRLLAAYRQASNVSAP